MITYSEGQTILSQETGVLTTDTTAMAQLTRYWNESRRTVAGINGGKWPYLEIEEETVTIAGQDYVQIPNHIEKVMSVRQQNGENPTDVIYRPRMVFDSDKWDMLLQTLVGPSSVPYNCYQRGDKLYIFPTPDTTGNRVIMRGRIKVKDINIADVTTALVTDTSYSTTFTGVLAEGATSATLSGAWGLTTGEYQVTFSNGDIRIVTFTASATTATWDDALSSSATATITVAAVGGGSILTMSTTDMTADFVGRWIRITQTSAAGGGDGYWYQIGAFYSSTLIALSKPYQGTELSGATAACTIGFITFEPEIYQSAALYRTFARWWQFKENTVLSERYWKMYDGGVEAGYTDKVGGLVGQMLEEANMSMEGPYIPPWPRDGADSRTGLAYYNPWLDATGLES